MKRSENAVCDTCALFKRKVKPHPNESTENLKFRPCALQVRPHYQGRQILGVGGELRVSPEGLCDAWMVRP